MPNTLSSVFCRPWDGLRLRFYLLALVMLTETGVGKALPQSKADAGLQPAAIFTQYTPWSGNSEILRRLLSPLAQLAIEGELERTSRLVSEQSINLAAERFVVYVPAVMPVEGYGLLVFVAPWQDAKVPLGWSPVLDSLGVIFVSAAQSGNSESPLGRRAPLALLSVHNIEQRYRVNPRRVYAGGFSGGSRVAMRLALAFPEVFSGALLNAGSDALGEGGAPLPPRDLFEKFRDSTRIVYVTGDRDAFHIDLDLKSEKSLRQWCIQNFDARITPFVSHDVATADALSAALRSLDEGAPLPSEANQACKVATNDRLFSALQKAGALIANGHRSQGHRSLLSIDARFGGLAMPQIVELARECDCGLMPAERAVREPP